MISCRWPLFQSLNLEINLAAVSTLVADSRLNDQGHGGLADSGLDGRGERSRDMDVENVGTSRSVGHLVLEASK